MRARTAFGATALSGLLLAWIGLLLPWLRWEAEASEPGTVSGFASSRPFWIVLAVATVVALVALRRRGGWPYAVLAAAALALVAIAVREAVVTLGQSSTYVSVLPWVGAALSLLGALVLLVAALVVLRPRGPRLAAVLAAVAAVIAAPAVWPVADGRPGEGAIADVADDDARALAFHDGTLHVLTAATVATRPAPDRSYDVLPLVASEWMGEPGFLRFSARGLAFSGDELFVSLGEVNRLVSIAPDGERRLLVSRPPERERRDPPVPEGAEPELVEDFVAGPLAAAPGGGIYVLSGDRVMLWRSGRLTTVADGLRRPTAIAVSGRAVYVADEGRVERIGPDGTVRTVVGTEAAPGCLTRGRDDPLALDVAACVGARALAVDDAGTVYIALRAVAMIAAVTPDGRMTVVAGDGPVGWGDGDGSARRARLGTVTALAVGPDGDLYVSERWPVARVRRIAAPASLLDEPPAEPQTAERSAACAAIARLSQEFLATGQVMASDRRAVAAALAALDRRIAALEASAPDPIRDDAQELAVEFRDKASALAEAGFDLQAVEWERRVDLYLGGFEMRPEAFDESIGDYAEEECRLAGGFDVPVDEVNAFCVAYRRYADRRVLVPSAGEEPGPEVVALVRAAPAPVAGIADAALDGLRQSAGRRLPPTEAAALDTRIEGLDTFASSVCPVL